MSRTIRRKNKQLERRYLGPIEDVGEYDRKRWQGRDIEQTYAKMRARYHRCRPSGVWGSSTHYWRRTYYNVPERRLETLLCHLVQRGITDDVVMPGRRRGANASYLWSIT